MNYGNLRRFGLSASIAATRQPPSQQ